MIRPQPGKERAGVKFTFRGKPGTLHPSIIIPPFSREGRRDKKRNESQKQCLTSIETDASLLGLGSKPKWPPVAGGSALWDEDRGQVLCGVIKALNKQHNNSERFPALAQSKQKHVG